MKKATDAIGHLVVFLVLPYCSRKYCSVAADLPSSHRSTTEAKSELLSTEKIRPFLPPVFPSFANLIVHGR